MNSPRLRNPRRDPAEQALEDGVARKPRTRQRTVPFKLESEEQLRSFIDAEVDRRLEPYHVRNTILESHCSQLAEICGELAITLAKVGSAASFSASSSSTARIKIQEMAEYTRQAVQEMELKLQGNSANDNVPFNAFIDTHMMNRIQLALNNYNSTMSPIGGSDSDAFHDVADNESWTIEEDDSPF